MAHLTVGEALAALAGSGEIYRKLLARPGLDVALYKPDGIDPQTPRRPLTHLWNMAGARNVLSLRFGQAISVHASYL